jgi:acetyl esterase/lipase
VLSLEPAAVNRLAEVKIPTLIVVGEEDTQEVLLSDSIRMAERLKAAGTEVKLEIWPGMFHQGVRLFERLSAQKECNHSNGW